MKRKIIWKPWIDPLIANDKSKQVLEVDEEEETYKDSYNAFEHDLMEKIKPDTGSPTGPIIVGPMGVIPLNEHNLPSKVFNFWMMHTNFNIGSNEANILESVPGVESLEIFSPYRCRVSFGMAFDMNEVKDEIEKALCEPTSTKRANTTALDIIKAQLKSKYTYWAIFVLPDGQIDYRTGDTRESISKEIESYPAKVSRIFTSWETNNGHSQKANSI
jgi:hypothetical protein